MSEEKDKSKKVEYILKYILEFGGIFIILGIILLFTTISTVKFWNQNDGKVYIDTLHVTKIDFFEISKKKKDTGFIVMDENIINNLKSTTDSINSKIKQVNKVSSEINKAHKENSEDYRLYLTLIGSVFAIVGFFGFKSIHDTRQMAIESVKIKSEEVAKKITNDKVEEFTKLHSENYIKKYLENEGEKLIDGIVKDIAFERSSKVAKDVAVNEIVSIRNDNVESRKALYDDIENYKKDNRILLSRIQELEKKVYGEPEPENNDEIPENNPNDEQPSV